LYALLMDGMCSLPPLSQMPAFTSQPLQLSFFYLNWVCHRGVCTQNKTKFQINKPKGVTQKIRERKWTSIVTWQWALNQKGIKERGVKQDLGT